MRELDERAKRIIPGPALMENAGQAVFQHVIARYGKPKGQTFRVFCGPGNNGGDGFVIARLLVKAGANVSVRLACEPSRITGDAKFHFDLLRDAAPEVFFGEPDSGIAIDALLGTGSRGAPRGEVAAAILEMRQHREIVSVDISSGLDADSGDAPGEVVVAGSTVTFAYPKRGMLVGRGPELTGAVVVDPIGVDWETLDPPVGLSWIRPSRFTGALVRHRSAHKGDFGHVLVIGGSLGMSGAPSLSAHASLRSGAGLVTAAVPASVQPLVAASAREMMTVALADEEGGLCADSLQAILDASQRCSAVVIGPGLGRRKPTMDLVVEAMQQFEVPMLIDADALFAIGSYSHRNFRFRAPVVMTPHSGECARLLQTTSAAIEEDRQAAVVTLAKEYGVTAVLKGASTLVAQADGQEIAINTTGNPGMATGGSGDVLSGVICAFLAKGMDAFEAACLGVYVHGMAGDLAAKEIGMTGLIAGDLIDHLPAACKNLEVAG
jgi:NAD(P)H-hydrate epimerase